MPTFQNTKTGEIHLVGVVRRPRHSDGFGLLFQQPLMDLLEDGGRSLSALEWRLLMYLVAVMEYQNVVDAHIGELADGIGHHRSAVSKSLTKLASWCFSRVANPARVIALGEWQRRVWLSFLGVRDGFGAEAG